MSIKSFEEMENNKTQKTVIEKAKDDFQSIIDFAKQQASADLEEKVEERIASLINEGSFSETQNEKDLNEAVTIETDEATVVVSDNGDVDVEPKNGEVITGEEEEEIEDLEMEEFEISEEAEEYLIQDEDMNLYNEEEPAVPAPAPEMAAEVPAPEVDAAQDLNAMSPEDLIKYAVEQIAQKTVGGAVEGGEEEAVTVVDDEMPVEEPMVDPAAAAPAAPAPAPVEEPVAEEIDLDSLLEDEETVIEIEDVNEDMGELSEDDIVEIELDEDEEPIDEMKAMGVSHSVQRTQGTSAGPDKSVTDRSRAAQVNENTAHEEAGTAELNNDNNKLVKENALLRKEVTKLRESLPVLRKQIHEMKEFNAKVGFMLRLFEQGEFTKEERINITEKFNQVDGYDNAKNLFKEVMNEHSIKVNQKPEAIKQGKTGKQFDRPAAQKETLFESADSKRMRELMTYGNKKR